MSANRQINKLIGVVLVIAYIVLWIGGVVHYIFLGGPPPGANWAASVFLLLAGLLVMARSPIREWIGLFGAALIGFFAEFIGVRYGFLFSPYRYTGVLAPQVLGVPLVMLFAWMALVSYVRQMLMYYKFQVWIEALLAAAWMTAIDLVIDPLAANRLGYWRWENSGAYYGIPLHNFAGWFLVSFVIFIAVRQKWEPNPWPRYAGLSIVLFFTVIAFSFGLIRAGTVGTLLCAIHLGIEIAKHAK